MTGKTEEGETEESLHVSFRVFINQVSKSSMKLFRCLPLFSFESVNHYTFLTFFVFQKLLRAGGPSTSDFNKPTHGLKVHL